MNLIKKLSSIGAVHAIRPSEKRNIIIVNYFAIIIIISLQMLIILRMLFPPSANHQNDSIGSNFDFIIASLIATVPIFLNYSGFTRIARLSLCWLPTIITIWLYTDHALENNGMLSTSEYDSIYFFLMSLACTPYLLLGVSNKKELITGLVVPAFSIIFLDIVLRFFGVRHVSNSSLAIAPEIYRAKAFIGYFILNACCLTIKRLVEKQDDINECLIKKLAEQNVLIETQATKKIMESKNRYQVLFEQAIDAIILINEKKEIEQVNPSACRIFRYCPKEFKELKLSDIRILPDNKGILLWNEMLNNEEPIPTEIMFRRKDGSIFPGEVNGKILADGSCQLFIKDISKRKGIELNLKEAEEKFRALVEKSLAGVYIINNGKLTYTNPQFAAIFGYKETELYQYRIETLLHPESINAFRMYIEADNKDWQRNVRYEIKGLHKTGKIINLEVFGSTTFINGESCIIGTLVDITENKRLQQKIMDQQLREQKKIVRAIIKAEEKERNRLGRELHDNINQILASINLYLTIAGDDGVEAKTFINNSKELVNCAINEIRNLSHHLVVPVKEVDLEELIKNLVNDLSITSVFKTAIIYEPGNKVLSDEIKLNIFRIIQEQINNILKHAEATEVIVQVKELNTSLMVMIKDNGKGFEPCKKINGIGLSNILTRIESLNGELEIISSPGNGCSLKIKIPQAAYDFTMGSEKLYSNEIK